MCDVRPGVRCSDHPRNKLKDKLLAAKKANEDLSKMLLTRDGLENDSPEAQVLDTEIAELEEKVTKLENEVEAWEFEYLASPEGLRDLQTALENPELTRLERLKAEVDLELAQKRHQWQLNMSKILRDAEDGPKGTDGAIELAQFELENINSRLEKLGPKEEELQAQLDQALLERNALLEEYRRIQHQGQPSQALTKALAAVSFIKAAMYRVRKLQMLYGLINKDLNKYIRSKGMKVAKNLAVGAAILAVEFFAGKEDRKAKAEAERNKAIIDAIEEPAEPVTEPAV